ncbi:pancreatic lipase-related protein 2-like [Onthophagus taurus]|uniref:pancreatic lipase-related protein 2-like n=1 Tax=Onthophagus taurus TaxID=166361 RepID=UPI000C208B22|nr:pancreatic lipase-related protein 2-like [Onthophagus taurus]
MLTPNNRVKTMDLLFILFLFNKCFTANGGNLQEDVKFYHVTLESNYIEVELNTTDLLTCTHDQEIKIYVHGWSDDINSVIFSNFVEEYHNIGFDNIFGIDWAKPAKNRYSASIDVVEEIGYYLADFIESLNVNLNVNYSQIHLIGHSLGAHICGYAGQRIKLLQKELIGRITGLDPAGPKFQKSPPNQRLSIDDALFVDIIHTDSGSLGYDGSLGHADFYPNGGSNQLGCGIFEISCSHNRARDYFIESINSEVFLGVSCDNYLKFENGDCDSNDVAIMGENIDRNVRGNFYLKTNYSSPFAIN